MSELIATAASSINAFTLAKRVAAFNVPVLIQGETGAGKECVAKYIHTVAFGENDNAPYIGVNCAAIPENMLEATLFGYDKGAFTGAIASVPGKMELANNGTLLLDEIGDMPLALQAKILRVLQEQQVERLGSNRQIKLNFRLIACTNKNLEQEVAAGRFREDLYYRLAVIPITMPPLRERLNDIIPLAESFIKKYSTVLVKYHPFRIYPPGAAQLPLARQRAPAGERHSAGNDFKSRRRDLPGCLRPAGNGRCRPQRTAMACSARRPHCRNQRFGPARTKRPVSIYR